MILPDVNVMVYAFRPDTSEHDVCRNWLESVVNSDKPYGMAPQVLSAFIRVATHPKIFANPSSLDEALPVCSTLLSQPHCIVIVPGKRHWDIFSQLCTETDAKGNLVPDAWFAALAIESRCDWITYDRDYARFPGLRWGLPTQ